MVSGTSATSITDFQNIGHSASNTKLPPLQKVTKDEAEYICRIMGKNLDVSTLGVVSVIFSSSASIDTVSGSDNSNSFWANSTEDKFGSSSRLDDYSTVKDYFFTKGDLTIQRLPSRLEQVAFSQWDSNVYTDEEITTLEKGLSLNATSRCNTSFANGLDSEYTNAETFGASSPYTAPATEDSKDGFGDYIRSLHTGSDITANCQSRYGVQDHVGNLSEMLSDSISGNIVAIPLLTILIGLILYLICPASTMELVA